MNHDFFARVDRAQSWESFSIPQPHHGYHLNVCEESSFLLLKSSHFCALICYGLKGVVLEVNMVSQKIVFCGID